MDKKSYFGNRLQKILRKIEHDNLEKERNTLLSSPEKYEYYTIGKRSYPILYGTHYSGIPHDDELNGILGYEALAKFIDYCKPSMHILDIGCGPHQVHARIMRNNGLHVSTLDAHYPADYRGAYEEMDFGELRFDAIWCCHCLEHVRNQFLFLEKINQDIKEEGLLSIIVPRTTDRILSGHINQYNEGQLLYNLVLAGFDCSTVKIGTSVPLGCISMLLRVRKITGTISTEWIPNLVRYFPFDAQQGFKGTGLHIGWDEDTGRRIYKHE